MIVLRLLLFLALIASAAASQWEFIQTRETEFVLNGSPFLFNGFNSYWLMNVASEPTDRVKITDVFRQAAAVGLTVCRTWAFNDGADHALQLTPGVYSEPVFQALDFVIAEARTFGIRLILSLTNNYGDYGGRSQYVKWAKAAGVAVNGDDDFYTNAVIKGYYKNHVEKVLTRVNTLMGVAYKDDPTIMAWELMNEPRCQSDDSGNTINGWVEETASYLKSIDKKHLLSVGMEGFYGDSLPDRKQLNPIPGYQVGTDFITSHLIKEIDFTTVHAYPDVWLSGQNEEAQALFMQRWMSSHWTDSKTVIRKPMVLAEFGKSSKDPGYSVSERDSFMNSVYDTIYNLAKNGGAIGGGLIWQVMDQGMESYYDGYEIILSQEPSTSSVMAQQSSKMAALEHS